MPNDVSASTAATRTADGGSDNDQETALHRARQEADALARRLRAAEAARDAWHGSYAVAVDQRDRERARVREMETCESYRLGRAVVSLVKRVAQLSPQAARRVTRRLAVRLRHYAGTIWVANKASPDTKAKPQLPVTLYLALGLELPELRRLLQAVKQGAALVPHAPVVVTDNAAFSLLRHFGVVMEYLPDRGTWERHGVGADWDLILGERLVVIGQDHDPAGTIVVDPLDLPTVGRLVMLNSRPD